MRLMHHLQNLRLKERQKLLNSIQLNSNGPLQTDGLRTCHSCSAIIKESIVNAKSVLLRVSARLKAKPSQNHLTIFAHVLLMTAKVVSSTNRSSSKNEIPLSH